jgi:hypothetical protein
MACIPEFILMSRLQTLEKIKLTDTNQIRHQQELVRQRGLLMTRYIAATIEVSIIRTTCLENIVRWRSQGSNSLLWDGWMKLLINGTDQEVIYVMTNDTDEWCKNLRRAGPYAGLVMPAIREYIFSKPLTDLPTVQALINFKPS